MTGSGGDMTSALRPFAEPGASTSRRADDLFAQYQRDIHKRTDQLFAGLMGFQWVAGIIFALWLSPLAWYGTVSRTHLHVWAAVFLGGAICLFPAVLGLVRPGVASTRYTIAVAQMLMGALLIHLTGGRIETHFHVFGSLAFLAFYLDWPVLITATIVVAADHFLRGIFWPESVYGIANPEWWRFLEHAGWVIFEDVFLVLSCVRGTQELRDIARTRAEIEAVSEQERGKSEALDRALTEAIAAREAAEKAIQI